MITETSRLFPKCHVLVENNAFDIYGTIKTDGSRWYVVTLSQNHINQQQYIDTLNSDEYTITVNNIQKISDDFYSFESSDIKYINIKLFESMHDWNIRYVYLIDNIEVYQG